MSHNKHQFNRSVIQKQRANNKTNLGLHQTVDTRGMLMNINNISSRKMMDNNKEVNMPSTANLYNGGSRNKINVFKLANNSISYN